MKCIQNPRRAGPDRRRYSAAPHQGAMPARVKAAEDGSTNPRRIRTSRSGGRSAGATRGGRRGQGRRRGRYRPGSASRAPLRPLLPADALPQPLLLERLPDLAAALECPASPNVWAGIHASLPAGASASSGRGPAAPGRRLRATLVGVAAFLATGLYMDRFHGHLRGYDDAVRMLFRSTHVYLLLSAVVNVVFGLHLRPAESRPRRALQALGSAALLAGPPFVPGRVLHRALSVRPGAAVVADRNLSRAGRRRPAPVRGRTVEPFNRRRPRVGRAGAADRSV